MRARYVVALAGLLSMAMSLGASPPSGAVPSPSTLIAVGNDAVLLDVDNDGNALASINYPTNRLIIVDPVTQAQTDVVNAASSAAIADESGSVVAVISASTFGRSVAEPALARIEPGAGAPIAEVTPPQLAGATAVTVEDVDATGRFATVGYLVLGGTPTWRALLVDLTTRTAVDLATRVGRPGLDAWPENLSDDGSTALVRISTTSCPACSDLYTVPTSTGAATLVSVGYTGAKLPGVYRGQLSGDGSTVAMLSNGNGVTTEGPLPSVPATFGVAQLVLRNLRAQSSDVVQAARVGNLSLQHLSVSNDGSAVGFAYTREASRRGYRLPPYDAFVYRADCERLVNASQADVEGAATSIGLAGDGKSLWFGFPIGGLISGLDGRGIYAAHIADCPSTYVSKAPTRLLDTRIGGTTLDGLQMGTGAASAGQTVELQLVGRRSIPSDAVAVALNVTVTNGGGSGYVTAFPCGPLPNASNLNFVAGEAVPNLVIVPLDDRGKTCLKSSESSADLIVDLSGYFPVSSSYRATAPTRLLDTRIGGSTADSRNAGSGRVSAGQRYELPVKNRGPVGNATAVALNVTAVDATSAGFVSVWPCDSVAPPDASNINFRAGAAVPNLVIVPVSSAGTVCLWSSAETQLIADVSGWFPPNSGFVGRTPARVLDDRSGGQTVDGINAGSFARVSDGSVLLRLSGRAGIPQGVGAVVLNVTAANPTQGGFATVWPCIAMAGPTGVRSTIGSPPNASNLNFVAGRDVANLVIAPVNADGEVCLGTYAGASRLIADVSGWIP